MAKVRTKLNKMYTDIREMRLNLNKIKNILIYKKDKEIIDSIKSNLNTAKKKILKIDRVFKYREDAIKSRDI